MNVLLQIKQSGDTRIVVDGEPGVGKTTFVKRICYIWAQRINETEGSNKCGIIGDFTLIIPIILKFINTENTLTDILTSQLKCLNTCEVCAVLKHQEENPNDILLLLDGFDEYTGQSFIENVIQKKENQDVLCITTSRAHAIERIKRHSSHSVQQHVRLCGFSEDQVRQYIKQFFEYHNQPAQKGKDLMKTLHEKPDLLQVAKIPIRTEMICVVWKVYGKLGDTLADLYERFILHLITHLDQKRPQCSKFVNFSEEEIWNASNQILIQIGKLANKWTKRHNLCTMYSNKELEDVLGDDSEKVIKIGLLTKSYPSSSGDASKWSFPHLTFQEYFIAYLLGTGTNDEDVANFTTGCTQYQYRVLSKCELIFTFLASKHPDTANKIITNLLLKETDKLRCVELFDFICKICPHFGGQPMDFPLPSHLNLVSHNKLNDKVLNAMLVTEGRQPNLKHFSTDDPKHFEKFMDLTYLSSLKVAASSEEQLYLVNQKIKHLHQLTSLSISSTVSFFLSSQEDVMKNIQKENLKYLSVTGPGALETVAENIYRFTFLEQLHVDEHSKLRDKTHGQKILSVLKDHKLIKQVSFSVVDLKEIIIEENVDIKVTVHPKKLQKGTLKVTSDMLTRGSTVALHSLDLSRNSLETEGKPLGEMLAKVAGLRVIWLGDCNLKNDTIQDMVDGIEGQQAKSCLHTLSFGHHESCNGNNLQSSGLALGKLIKLMPDLEILDMAECNVQSYDFGAMSDILDGVPTKIHTLNLSVDNLGEAKQGGFRFLQLTPELQKLKAGGYSNDDPLPAICGAIETRVITKLNVLDVSDSCVTSKSLLILGKNLHLLNSLEVLNFKGIEGAELEDYIQIYENIPPSLTHLNLNSDQTAITETSNLFAIIDNKNLFGRLQRLNITLTESDLDYLQEQLEKVNPEINVYREEEENIWRMYVWNNEEDYALSLKLNPIFEK